MGAVWFVGRAELRRRWRSVVVLTVLVGLVGAVVLASLAGARRTSTAFGRFQDETLAADLTVFVPAVDDATLADLRALPGVTAIGTARQLTADVEGHTQSNGGPLDDELGRTVDRPRVIEGRRPRPDRVDEIAVPEPLARRAGVGSATRSSSGATPRPRSSPSSRPTRSPGRRAHRWRSASSGSRACRATSRSRASPAESS